MGQIANDMVSGQCCSHCGTYFETEHGFPVLCKSCWKSASADDRRAYQRATQPEV